MSYERQCVTNLAKHRAAHLALRRPVVVELDHQPSPAQSWIMAEAEQRQEGKSEIQLNLTSDQSFRVVNLRVAQVSSNSSFLGGSRFSNGILPFGGVNPFGQPDHKIAMFSSDILILYF